MRRLLPTDEPMICPRANCSSPIARTPRPAQCDRIALPIPPKPTTATSYLIRVAPNESQRSRQSRYIFLLDNTFAQDQTSVEQSPQKPCVKDHARGALAFLRIPAVSCMMNTTPP